MKGHDAFYKQAREGGHNLHLRVREVRLRPQRHVGGGQVKISGNNISDRGNSMHKSFEDEQSIVHLKDLEKVRVPTEFLGPC